MAEPLTALERKVYHYLLDFLATHSYQPSVREIARRFRIRSTKSVSELLSALAVKGYIRREQGRSRGVTLLGVAGAPGVQPVAVWDVAPAAGSPVTQWVTLDRRLVPADDCFLLRITDDALASHAIRAGDYAIVHPSARVVDGDLVAGRIGRTPVARLVLRRGPVVALQAPGQPDVSATAGDDAAVLGRIVGVIRLPSGIAATADEP